MTVDADVIALQEVSVAKHQIPFLAAEFLNHGATVLFSPLGSDVQRVWGARNTARLGRGVAIVCKEPWVAAPPDHLFVPIPKDQNPGQRLVSALAVKGQESMIIHCAYLSVTGDEVNEWILEQIHARLTQRPHAHRIIAGDWQGDFSQSWLGMKLYMDGCVLHSILHPDEPTNFSAIGTNRKLDDIAVSPNIKPLVQSSSPSRRLREFWDSPRHMPSFRFNSRLVVIKGRMA